MKPPVKLILAFMIVGLSACASHTEQNAFDLESATTGKLDDDGFPVFVGRQYEREIPLKRGLQRYEIEQTLKELAQSRKQTQDELEQNRSTALQQKLLKIRKTHDKAAEAEIEAACVTGENGVVTCRGD